MVKIEAEAGLDRFREFLILSTCRSFMPIELKEDPSVFPEREEGPGPIYVEAEDKVTVQKMGEITFVKVNDALGVIYESKSGNTKLKWRQIRGRIGKVTGTASGNSVTNLITAGVIGKSYIEKILKEEQKISENGIPNIDDSGTDKPQRASAEGNV
ncbi:MAG: hypothetical protein M1291_04885 [Thaumarchaeota archaeon]|nr:hypothetical protein [Nitrososphaerota archaeon]